MGLLCCEAPRPPLPSPSRGPHTLDPWATYHTGSRWSGAICREPSMGSKFLNKSQGHRGHPVRDWTTICCRGNGFSTWPLTNGLSRWASRRKQGWLRVSLPGLNRRMTHLLRQRRQAGGPPWMLGISVKVLSSLQDWGFLKCRDHLSIISPSPAEPRAALGSVQWMMNLCCPVNAKVCTSVVHTVFQTARHDPLVGREITFSAADQHFY